MTELARNFVEYFKGKREAALEKNMLDQ